MRVRRSDADVLIVGGGPAGLAAAIYAVRAGLAPLVFEARRGVVDKACGEGLMPSAIAALHAIGVDPPGFSFRGICYRDARQAALSARGEFGAGPGRGVRRTELHAALRARARELGVEILEERVAHVEQSAHAVTANGRRGRYLLAADGLHSRIRRDLGLHRSSPTRRFGVRRHYRCAPWTDLVEVYWAPGAEAYVTPVDDDLVGVALLFDASGRFETLLEHFPLLRERLPGEPVTAARGAGPFEQRSRRVVAGRILLIGDAAGYADALTGEGVDVALTTAQAAVAAIAREDISSYGKAFAAIERKHRATRLLLAATRPRWMHGPMIRLLRTFPALFDAALTWLGDDAKPKPVLSASLRPPTSRG